VAAPASSQFGAPPFLPDGPLSLRSSPEPSVSVEDCDNFDISLLPPDDFHMASNDDTFSFDHPYVDDLLSSTSLPIEHHPDFSNVGAHLELCEESDSTLGSNNDDDDNDGIHHGNDDNPLSSSLFHADDSPAGSSAFSGFVQPEVPYDIRVINDSRLKCVFGFLTVLNSKKRQSSATVYILHIYTRILHVYLFSPNTITVT
jgi:hypothetical protein